MAKNTICCHQFAVLDCQRCEKVRFVATSLRCSIVKDGKKYDLLPPVCARLSKMGRSTICCHQVVLNEGKKYDLSTMGRSTICCHQFVLKDGKKYDLLPPVCGARLSKMGRSSICCHKFVLECQRWEVRFVATSLCWIAKDGKKYDLLPPVCAQRWEEVRFVATSLCSKVGKSTVCGHQFVPECQRWEKVRVVATSLRCWIVKDGKKYDLLPPVCARVSKMGKSTICCHQFVLECQRREEVRFVATSLQCSMVKDGKKYDLLPPVCARLSKMGRSTICCHQFVLDCQRWEEVRFVATSLRSSIVKDRKKYDLLPPVCAERWEEVRLVATSLRCSIVKDGKKYDLLPPVCASVKDGKKYDLLPPVWGARLSKIGRSTVCCHQFARLSKMGRRTICCHQFVLDYQRWEEVRFVATSLCSIVKDGKKYDFVANSLCSIVEDGRKYVLLPPVDCQRWEEVRFVATSLCSKMGRGTICCNQFVPECARWEKVRFVATSLRCWIVKDGKKYDLLPPVCARLPKMGRSTVCCHQFVLDCQRWEEVRFVATSLMCSIVKDGKKYDLFAPVCGARLPKMGRSTICCHQFVLKGGKNYDLLPPACGARLSKM